MNKLSLLLITTCIACSSSDDGSTQTTAIALNLSDTRGSVQAYPSGYWEFTRTCSTPDGKPGANLDRGTWDAPVMSEVQGYTRDPAMLAFAAKVTGAGCPQGGRDEAGIFFLMLPTHNEVCWRADAAMKPDAIIGLEKLFGDLLSSSQSKAQSCAPLRPQDADMRINSGSTGGISGTAPAPAPAPRP